MVPTSHWLCLNARAPDSAYKRARGHTPHGKSTNLLGVLLPFAFSRWSLFFGNYHSHRGRICWLDLCGKCEVDIAVFCSLYWHYATSKIDEIWIFLLHRFYQRPFIFAFPNIPPCVSVLWCMGYSTFHGTRSC